MGIVVKKLILCSAALLAIGVTSAGAADMAAKVYTKAPPPMVAFDPWDIAFGAAITNNYVFRGVTQSNREASVNAYFEPRFNVNKDLQLYVGVAGNSISYDDNGCLTDDGTFAFTYDTENQLIEADDGSTVSSYIYDPMRRQNQKDVGGTKTRYLYNGMRMIAEYDGSGTLQKKYVYGPGLDEVLIELDSSNNKTYLHHDSKGSIIAISNGSGVVVNSLAYSPFGESGSLSGTTFGYRSTLRSRNRALLLQE
mgnify:CR=1 FL=1